MKHLLLSVYLLLSVVLVEAQGRKLAPDTMVVTRHQVTVKGKNVPYTAQVGTQPVWHQSGSISAYLQYTYYERTAVHIMLAF